MKTYAELIKQNYKFPTAEFSVKNGELYFHNIRLMDIVTRYQTPAKLSYLPKVEENISRARKWFTNAFRKYNYTGTYTYTFCTKASHFKFILDKTLGCGAQIETSSDYDIPILRRLFEANKLTKDTLIIANGFKKPGYTQHIADLINEGFNCIPVLDNIHEVDAYKASCQRPYHIGIRIATNEEPDYAYYSSRLGVRYDAIRELYESKIAGDPQIELKMLHFFMNTGMRDTVHFWNELDRMIEKYCELRQICPTLDTLNIGGGLPIKSSLQFEYDYPFMIEAIVQAIGAGCEARGVAHPHLITEFGSFTVGESGAVLYTVLDQKIQNEQENWYMINGSFITQLPDAWGLSHKYILLPLNGWNNEFQAVNLGGLTCDGLDYYNSEANSEELFLPKTNGQPLHLGFFHTGAYQEALGGYGGIQHCLVPSPRHVVIDRTDEELKFNLFRDTQPPAIMLDILGY
jgi:arginine decarboxylase